MKSFIFSGRCEVLVEYLGKCMRMSNQLEYNIYENAIGANHQNVALIGKKKLDKSSTFDFLSTPTPFPPYLFSRAPPSPP